MKTIRNRISLSKKMQGQITIYIILGILFSGCTVLMRPTVQIGTKSRSRLTKIPNEKIELVYIHFPEGMKQFTINAKPSHPYSLSTWEIPVGQSLSNTIFDCLSFSFNKTLLLETPEKLQDSPQDRNSLYISPTLKNINSEFEVHHGIMASRESAFAPMKYFHLKGNMPTHLVINRNGKSISREINYEFDECLERIPQTTWEVFDEVISEISINYVEYIKEILNTSP
jgi:hypothetical protein